MTPLNDVAGDDREGARWAQMVFQYQLAVVDAARAAGLPAPVAARLADELATDADLARALAEQAARLPEPEPDPEVESVLKAWGLSTNGVGGSHAERTA